jgi:hypothetical protein
MFQRKGLSHWLKTCGLLLALSACGGGGGGGGSTGSGAVDTGAVLTGVAATGAAFTGAIVTVYDSTGKVVGNSAAVAADGSYSVTLRTDAKAPFVLMAVRPPNAAGATESLTSVVPDAATLYVNITPMTDLIAARLSLNGDPAALYQQLQAGTATVTSATVAARVLEVQTLLQPVFTALGITATDPLSGKFSVDGTGYDRLLDTTKVRITPNGASSNIEVSLAVKPTNDTDQPTVVQFASNKTGELPSLPAVDPKALVPSGTSAQITSLLSRMTACFAVPYASRVSNATGTQTTGTATNVIAPACKAIFVGGDPATYKHNGNVVALNSSNSGPFTGLFRASATGMVFDQGTFEFYTKDNSVVLGYRSRDTAGNEVFDSLVAKVDTDNVLKFYGNQYKYNGGVSASHQERKFVTLNQSAYSYYSSGYNLMVDQLNGQFSKVEVVTPKGNTITLVAATGLDFLKINGPNGATKFLRLRSEFIDTKKTADPRISLTTDAGNLAFANPTFSNEELAALPAQSVWTFRYFLAGNTTAVPDGIQTYKTRARALTISELRNRPFAAPTDAALAELSKTADLNGNVPLETNFGAQPSWTVPTGALPPTQVTIFGRAPAVGSTPSFNFDDSTFVGSTLRTAIVRCTPASSADTHCNGGTNGGFTANAVGTGISLNSRDVAGRDYSGYSAGYKLTVVP